MIKVEIFVATFFLTGICLLFPGPNAWAASIKKKPLIAIILILVISSVFLGSPRGLKSIADNPVGTIRLIRIIILSLIAAVSIFLILRNGFRFSNGWGIRWMLCYSIIAMISSIYSTYPLFTLWKGFEVFVTVICGFMLGSNIGTEDDIKDILHIVYVCLLFLVISALAGIVICPELAYCKTLRGGTMSFTYQGVFPLINPNSLTQISALLACIALTYIVFSKKNQPVIMFTLIFFCSLICMILSHSRTSILAFIIATFFIFLVLGSKIWALAVAWIGTFVVLTGSFIKIFIAYFRREQDIIVFHSLSGRLEFWPIVWDKIMGSPIIGYGFYTAHRMVWGGATVDNAYLEVLLGLGSIGLIPFIAAILCGVLSLLKIRPSLLQFKTVYQSQLWVQLSIILFFILVRSITGPSFQVYHINLVLFIVILVSSRALVRIKKEAV